MRLLLDSHALLWWMDDAEPRLGPRTRDVIRDAEFVGASIASAWEIAIKVALGKLRLDLAELLRGIDRDGIELLPIERAHCLAVATLPRHHGDPFDRMIVAQALAHGLTLVTDDRQLSPYGVALIGCG